MCGRSVDCTDVRTLARQPTYLEYYYSLGILDKDELPIYSSEEDSDIEEDDANENDNDKDVIQAMSDMIMRRILCLLSI